MAEYHSRHPGIDFRVVNAASSETAAAVLSGALDLAVVGLGPRQVPEGLDHRILAGDLLVLIVAADHALADRNVVHLADLPESHQLICSLRGYSVLQGGEESDSCGAGQGRTIRCQGGSPFAANFRR
ncbi:LysR substrate-binding domain-containing protein [Streptomyces mirabilis]|uniref:LysR substrate-binding domain-containing protein n=1 Tax=Streptomyces mirabilis TaxID=68239 RepID=UPI002257F494|nr:LysR substrate-binding domain-containing protein [Streptomyces mirabilis]MCX4426334.1 LysR substrate-binding domain-containing protein [Streptomyces mirabilis]MCZ0997754.1 LysR substrate-binding domain-containing protein [Streptomyces mirabilis]